MHIISSPMYFYTLYQTTNQGDLITTPSYKPFRRWEHHIQRTPQGAIEAWHLKVVQAICEMIFQRYPDKKEKNPSGKLKLGYHLMMIGEYRGSLEDHGNLYSSFSYHPFFIDSWGHSMIFQRSPFFLAMVCPLQWICLYHWLYTKRFFLMTVSVKISSCWVLILWFHRIYGCVLGGKPRWWKI